MQGVCSAREYRTGLACIGAVHHSPARLEPCDDSIVSAQSRERSMFRVDGRERVYRPLRLKSTPGHSGAPVRGN